jgi:replicative DNA helicase
VNREPRRGGDYVLDAPAVVPAVWGKDDEILMSEGEPLLICGGTGAGKTTLL